MFSCKYFLNHNMFYGDFEIISIENGDGMVDKWYWKKGGEWAK